MGFELIKDTRLEPGSPSMPEPLAQLHAYWDKLRAGRAMPRRTEVDPVDIAGHLRRVHLMSVEGPDTFRFRIYGGGVTNPDAVDMTGRTTMDYSNPEFCRLVTRHLGECVAEAKPVSYEVIALLDAEPYEYTFIALPLSENGSDVNMLLVRSVRITVPDKVRRWQT